MKDGWQKDVYDKNMIKQAKYKFTRVLADVYNDTLDLDHFTSLEKVTKGQPKSLYTAVIYAFSYITVYTAPTCGLVPHKHSWYDDECHKETLPIKSDSGNLHIQISKSNLLTPCKEEKEIYLAKF